MQTGICRLDKQQGPMYSMGNYIQCSVINHNGEQYEKECVCGCIYIYIYIAESLCCTAVINTTL